MFLLCASHNKSSILSAKCQQREPTPDLIFTSSLVVVAFPQKSWSADGLLGHTRSSFLSGRRASLSIMWLPSARRWFVVTGRRRSIKLTAASLHANQKSVCTRIPLKWKLTFSLGLILNRISNVCPTHVLYGLILSQPIPEKEIGTNVSYPGSNFIYWPLSYILEMYDPHISDIRWSRPSTRDVLHKLSPHKWHSQCTKYVQVVIESGREGERDEGMDGGVTVENKSDQRNANEQCSEPCSNLFDSDVQFEDNAIRRSGPFWTLMHRSHCQGGWMGAGTKGEVTAFKSSEGSRERETLV